MNPRFSKNSLLFGPLSSHATMACLICLLREWELFGLSVYGYYSTIPPGGDGEVEELFTTTLLCVWFDTWESFLLAEVPVPTVVVAGGMLCL